MNTTLATGSLTTNVRPASSHPHEHFREFPRPESGVGSDRTFLLVYELQQGFQAFFLPVCLQAVLFSAT